jgi:Fe-S-cluster containining protein
MSQPTDTPWFASGLRFECLRGCRRCCTGEPGAVWVSQAEIAALSAFLGQRVAEFLRANVRVFANGKLSLAERANGDCVLLGPDGCTAYPVRPRQCRDYPFWQEVLASPEAWDKEKYRCPGIGQGPLHEASTILKVLEEDDGGR